MAHALTFNLHHTHELIIWRYLAIASLLLLGGACGMVDYDIKEQNFFASSSKKKDIGVLRFHYSDSTESYDIRARRVKGGYAIQAPLYEGDIKNDSHINFTASRTKSLDYFVGIEGKLSF